jgi:RNA polymerase sigma-70 factor (ECF subfamily)
VSDLIAHIPGLRRYARLLTCDATRADDLVQDTLERALRKWRLFSGGAGLRSWLLTIMHNLWASQMRVMRSDDSWNDDEHAQALGADADHSLAVALRMDTQRALATLPEAQRAVLLLVVIEELSYAEVAKVLDLPPGTVMSRLSRARAGMRAAMAAPAGTAAGVASPVAPQAASQVAPQVVPQVVPQVAPLRPASATGDGTGTSTVTPLACGADTSSEASITPPAADTVPTVPATRPWRVVGGRR